MKRITLLVTSGILALGVIGCQKGGPQGPQETTSKDEQLAGEAVTVGETGAGTKLFILNEGAFQANNCTLDFLRYADGCYISDAFGKMNPTVPLGLGDTGNDIAVYDDKIWIVLNGSGAVTVLDARDESLIGTLEVPAPRHLAFIGNDLYVTSYEGAVWGGEAVLGAVYGFDVKTLQPDGKQTVGCQPEGLAASNGNLYIANSGGYQANGYEMTLSVLDATTLEKTDEIPVADNLHEVLADDSGNLWITTYGIGEYDAEWNYVQTVACNLYRYDIASGKISRIPDVHASRICRWKDGIAAIGNDAELAGGESWSVHFIHGDGTLAGTLPQVPEGTLYGLCWNPSNDDFYLTTTDYTTPGKVYAYDAAGKPKWSAQAGLNPAHLAVW
ncbi:MAG: hypothetical protein IJ652_06995 [Bacteroidales bacterium]|nr:hypothetical protein [Bacteroidales bacterium]